MVVAAVVVERSNRGEDAGVVVQVYQWWLMFVLLTRC
jgi:hypothetical protein